VRFKKKGGGGKRLEPYAKRRKKQARSHACKKNECITERKEVNNNLVGKKNGKERVYKRRT